jgi:hypothetical protein
MTQTIFFNHKQSEIIGNAYITIKTTIEIRGDGIKNYQQKLRQLYLREKITKEVLENASTS